MAICFKISDTKMRCENPLFGNGFEFTVKPATQTPAKEPAKALEKVVSGNQNTEATQPRKLLSLFAAYGEAMDQCRQMTGSYVQCKPQP